MKYMVRVWKQNERGMTMVLQEEYDASDMMAADIGELAGEAIEKAVEKSEEENFKS